MTEGADGPTRLPERPKGMGRSSDSYVVGKPGRQRRPSTMDRSRRKDQMLSLRPTCRATNVARATHLAQAMHVAQAMARAAISATTVVLLVLVTLGGPTAGAVSAQAPEITIELTTNEVDADSAPGPTINAGDPITWRYLVTVNGPTTMYDAIVSDSSGASPSCDIDGDGGLDGTHIHPGPLEAGQSFSCVATGTAQAEGTVSSTASVRAFDFDGLARFDAEDRSFHTSAPVVVTPTVVADPGLTLQSLVNGVDGNTAPGPYVAEGTTITWSYVVTNTGNVPLASVTVDSTHDAAVDCGGGTNVVRGNLAPGSAVTCSATSEAAVFEAGLQATEGTVSAAAIDPSSGTTLSQLSARDPHTYTPVRLPGALAFTGHGGLIAPLGAILVLVGLSLALYGSRLTTGRNLM